MPDLIAQGTQSRERWRRTLPTANQACELVLGRGGGAGHVWAVPWDDRISREHAMLLARDDGSVLVSKLGSARNPIFYHGRKHDSFTLGPGEHFVIGHTTFTLAVRPEVNVSDPRAGVTEHIYEMENLRRRGFRETATRIEALGRLPDIIGSSSSDDELLVRVVSLLMQSILSASAVAIMQVPTEANLPPTILHYDNRSPAADGPRPSARIVRQAAMRNESVLQLWAAGDDHAKIDNAYTASEEVDWAFGVPIGGEACQGWVIYVAGQLQSLRSGGIDQSLQAAPENLHDDVKFTELVGTTVASLRQSRMLQRRQVGMKQFFAPVVMDAMLGRDPEDVLKPRETDVSVLFCDLRGFTRQSEQSQGRLLELLQRVSDALGVMTGEILKWGGVVGDFHGDAAMGFWGWPLDQNDAVLRAASAALAIRDAFRDQANDSSSTAASLHGFRCGIGVATGRAVAGRIGTVDQVKVTAFGPVVNLASRLEGMTKALGVELLIDDVTANWIRTNVKPIQMRVRKLAIVRPAGFESPLEVSQLLPPADVPDSPSDNDVELYETALRLVTAGDWDRAFDQLHRVSANDRAKDFLTATILRHGRIPPSDWTGVVDIAK